MSAPEIRAALETALNAMTPSLATAWQNVPYTPVQGTPYQEPWLLAAPPENPEMGGLAIERGIFKIKLKYPLNGGAGPAEARAKLIKQTFYRGRSFTSGGVTTWIERTPTVGGADVEPDRFVVPVDIPYRAQIQTGS